MTFWQRLVRRPRTVFLRKACFQIHLWLGLALGLYVVVLSLTGSALVFRREMDRAISPARPPIERTARARSEWELAADARRAYPGFTVERMGLAQRRVAVRQMSLQRDGETIERVFNVYTGEDLGDPFPPAAQALLWVTALHDDLLMTRNQRGRFWNGVGSILTTVLCLTGAIVWWPGIASWRRGVKVKRRSKWPRFNFDLHSSLGFWFFGLIAIWAVSGIYLSFPSQFMMVVDYFAGPQDRERPVDLALAWLARLHFGRWSSHTLKVVWVVAGLVPPVMFVTGVVMWWNRVVRKPRAAGESSSTMHLQQEVQGVE